MSPPGFAPRCTPGTRHSWRRRCRSSGRSSRRSPGPGAFGPDWMVTPAPLRGPATIDTGLAGTVMRFVPPVAALADGPVRFDGDPAARRRPMATVVTALRELGVAVDDDGDGRLPFTVHGRGAVRGGRLQID